MKDENQKLLFDASILKEMMFKSFVLGEESKLDNPEDVANNLLLIIIEKMEEIQRADEALYHSGQVNNYISSFCDYSIYQNIEINADDILDSMN